MKPAAQAHRPWLLAVLVATPFIAAAQAGATATAAVAAQAAESALWFAVLGDPADSGHDLAELNVASLQASENLKRMQLRVNLAEARVQPGGARYASYTSDIQIDCQAQSVVHLRQTRYEQHHWQGATVREEFPNARPMAFRGLAPDPKPRVLRAACAGR